MFNLLGPMANPGRVRRQVIGVADPRFAERMLASLRAHGSTDVWVVHGGGLDELTTTGTSTVLALAHDGSVRTFAVDPVSLGLAPATKDQLVGGDPAANADAVRRVLAGERGAAPRHRRAQRRRRPRGRRRCRHVVRRHRPRQRGHRRRQGGRHPGRPHQRVAVGAVVTVVHVPASSANLGPGFDALGMALDIYADIGVVDGSRARPESAQVVDERHPATVAFAAAGGTGRLWVRSPIPIGRGLGFSGAMRVGGAAAAFVQRGGCDALAEHRRDVLSVAAGLEGHADNVAASLYGGVIATDGERALRVETTLHPDVVLWIPEATTSTPASRTALPSMVPFDDAVFNVGRTALLLAALSSGDVEALTEATQDRLHQDRRLGAAEGSRRALAAGTAAGAWCGWLSGSGPTVAFLAATGTGERVAAALPAGGHCKVVGIDEHGTIAVD